MEKNKVYFPLFIDLSEKKILVVGGGKIAARRVHTLIPFCSKIKVVAPEIAGEILEKPVECEKREFVMEDLEGADLVLAATNNPAVDEIIWNLCRQKKIPVNIASDKSKCDFFFGGIIQDKNVVVGITASGADHRQARKVREKIEKTCFFGKSSEE